MLQVLASSSGSLSATPRKKPEVVTSVGLTAGSSRLVVVFTPPTDNGGSALTYKYKIRKSDGSYGR
jgi:type IV secretory pathway ATPase VirB11/archaellum biosynthesis ATPase